MPTFCAYTKLLIPEVSQSGTRTTTNPTGQVKIHGDGAQSNTAVSVSQSGLTNKSNRMSILELLPSQMGAHRVTKPIHSSSPDMRILGRCSLICKSPGSMSLRCARAPPTRSSVHTVLVPFPVPLNRSGQARVGTGLYDTDPWPETPGGNGHAL
jgi:hypothetical protein